MVLRNKSADASNVDDGAVESVGVNRLRLTAAAMHGPVPSSDRAHVVRRHGGRIKNRLYTKRAVAGVDRSPKSKVARPPTASRISSSDCPRNMRPR